MVDPKKLITGFLLLATLVSSFVFIFSNLNSDKKEGSDLKIAEEVQKNTKNALSGPVFENLPEPVGAVADENPEFPKVEDPTNLTDSLANQLAIEMATLDPSQGGLLEEKAGGISPKIESLTSQKVQDGEVLGEVAKWEKLLQDEISKVKVQKGSSDNEINDYISDLGVIVEDNLKQGGFGSLSNSSVASSYLDLATNRMFLKVKDMKVPEELLAFHQKLLTIAFFNKAVLQLAQDENDPLKSSLILNSYEKEYRLAALELQAEARKIQGRVSLNSNETPLESLVGIFSVKKAHALFGIGDITQDILGFGRDLWEWAQKIATEFVKKRLVHQMVQQTINWIQGKGKPRFIQDFKGFVAGEADKAVGTEIYKHIPELCSPISKWVKSAFYGVGLGSTRIKTTTERTRCTLSEVVNNIEVFYDSFGAGGWKGYLEVIQPQNNVFGSIILLSDIALQEEAKEKEAATTNAQASNGLLATRKCVNVKERSINGALAATIIGEDELSNPSDPAADAGLVLGRYGETPVNAQGEEINVNKIKSSSFYGCPQNGWQITTPGSTVGTSLARAVGADLDWIVNAQDLAALATAFVDSLVNKMFRAGVEGIASATVLKSPKQTAEDLRKSCESFASGTPEYQDCLTNVEDTIRIYESVITNTSTILTTIQGYRDISSRIIEYDDKYIDLVNVGGSITIGTTTYQATPLSALEAIALVLTQCPYIATNDQKLKDSYIIAQTDAINGLVTAIKEKSESQSNLLWLDDFERRLMNATDTIAISELSQELSGKFDSSIFSLTLSAAIDRYNKLKAIYNQAIGIYFTNGTTGYLGEGIGIRCR